MRDATFACPDLTTFCRLDELGLVVSGQRLEPGRAVLACRVVEPDQWCHRCGCEGVPRGTVVRRLAHEPLGWRPTTLEVAVRRYRCAGCGHVWRQDTTSAAEPRAKLSRRGLRWALEAVVVGHLTVSRVAEGLGAWTAGGGVTSENGRTFASLDAAWVLATLAVLGVAGSTFTSTGLAAALLTGLLVADLGALQWRAANRLKGGLLPPSALSHSGQGVMPTASTS